MSKIIAITLAIFAAATICQALDLGPMPMVPLDLSDFLLKSSDAMQKNPQQTTQCFDTYKPKIDECAEVYKQQLDGCHNDAAASQEKINNEVAGNVASINQWGNDICSSYNKCNQDGSNPLGFFQCNNAAAGDAMTNSYNIQTMSKDKMDYVSVQNQMIQYTQKSCSDKSESEYVQTSKSLYDQLQSCITNPPPVAPTTVAPPETSVAPN